jgi:hypothetical protein
MADPPLASYTVGGTESSYAASAPTVTGIRVERPRRVERNRCDAGRQVSKIRSDPLPFRGTGIAA